MILRFAMGTLALCVAVILLTHALILGFKEEIKAKVFGFWGHIQITGLNINQTFESPPISMDQPFYPMLDTLKQVAYDWEDDKGHIRKAVSKGGVRHIQIFGLKPGILTKGTELEGVLLKGVGTDFQWDYMRQYLQSGDILETADTIPARQILLSQSTANRLKVKLNDNIIIYFITNEKQVERKFTVSGIYKTGLEEYDKKFAFVDIRHIRELAGWKESEVSGFEIMIDHLEDAPLIAEYLYYEHIPDELYIETIRQKFPAIFDWVELQDINEQVLLWLMLLVIVINLATVLLILILERYNMVGILKTLGASDWSIRLIFIRLTVKILVIGLMAGNGLAMLLGFIQQKTGFFKLEESEYYLSTVPIRWDPLFILFVNIFIIVVATITLLIPSLYINRISPIKAIRFK